jgi:hypothetical protein
MPATPDDDERRVGRQKAGQVPERRPLLERRVMVDRLASAGDEEDATVDPRGDRVAAGGVLGLGDLGGAERGRRGERADEETRESGVWHAQF